MSIASCSQGHLHPSQGLADACDDACDKKAKLNYHLDDLPEFKPLPPLHQMFRLHPESTVIQLQQIDIVLRDCLNALESDSTMSDRRTAFQAIQDLYEPGRIMSLVPREDEEVDPE